ncbi:MAG: methionine--tRNA ligase [Candidatus Portnoybacteria bacterium]|nr:methionine--tRNA ligase [Candidatus Portnoybacteria bacterium]
MPKKFYITTPIYYTNQPPHIGTAYTTVAADILARYHRKLGEDVFFLTGTDEHGENIAQAAEKTGKSPQEFVDEIAELFKKAWKKLNISYDDFIRTTEERHKKGVEKSMLKLKQSGKVYQDDYKALYCSGCEDFIFKKDLVDGKCPYHKEEPKLISEKNYFFKLSDFLPQVKELIEKDKIIIKPKERKKEVLSLLKQDLGNLSISRQKVKWGIPLPFDKKQTVYVWVDALLNYLTAIGYENNPKQFKRLWPADLHLIAKDIVKFHAIFFPALLLAAGLKPPRKIFIHGFFTVNGQKMSKTLGNVIDPIYLVDEYGTDALRYFLLREISFGQDGDFSIKRFKERYNADLANGLGNLVSRVLTLSEKIKPAKSADGQLTKKIKSSQKNYQKAMEEIKFHEALESVWQLISFCDEYIEKNKPWQLIKNQPEKFKQIISELLIALKEIASLLEPFMPATSEKILKQIKQNKKTAALFPRL